MLTRHDVDVLEAPGGGLYPRTDAQAQPATDVGRLLLRCPDRPGLVAAVSTFLT
jgi:formyltetrahydrofolate deformylase